MFQLTVVTPQGKILKRELDRISLPTTGGVRTLLTNHIKSIMAIDIGVVTLIEPDKKREPMAVSEGIFYFDNNEATLLVRTFELEGEIDRERALRARERAEERLTHAALSSKESRELELALKRALSRLSATQ